MILGGIQSLQSFLVFYNFRLSLEMRFYHKFDLALVELILKTFSLPMQEFDWSKKTVDE